MARKFNYKNWEPKPKKKKEVKEEVKKEVKGFDSTKDIREQIWDYLNAK